jgi:hypothetical protein
MKFPTLNKRAVAIGLTAGIAAGAAGIAAAYFTSAGSGTGSATDGSSTPLTITQTASITGLTPGSGSQPVAYTITNPTANGAQNIGAVTVSNIAVTASHSTAGCLVSWFSTSAPSAAVGTLTAGEQYTSTTSTEPSVQLINVTSSQDACEGATLTLTLTAASGS